MSKAQLARPPVALAEPQPGDFTCVPIPGWAGLGIEVGQFLDGEKFQPYEHAEVYVGQPDADGPFGYTVSAYPSRKGRVPLPCPPALLPGSLWSSGIIAVSTAQRDAIVAWSAAHEHVGYSGLDYAALVIHRLRIPAPHLKRYIESTAHLICSQFVDTAYDQAGVHLFDDKRWPGYVTPGDLAGLLESIAGLKPAG